VPAAWAYAAGLAALGAWATYTSYRALRAPGAWSAQRWQVLLAGLLLVAGCSVSAASLLQDRFAPWMLLPIGASYGWFIPLPCYFRRANRGWLHVVRNVAFAMVAVSCFAVGLGLVSLPGSG
jgi:hypothetical protein